MQERLREFGERWSVKLIRLKQREVVHQDSQRKDFKRVLNVFDVLAFGLGSIIGAGIFVLTGVAARTKAGPAVVFSYLMSGVACIFSALCYSEFASRAPISGSAYTYAYTVIGEFVAWIIGWDLSLEYTLAAAAVARGWSGYLVLLFQGMGVQIPTEITDLDLGFTRADPVAALIVIVLTLLLIYGVKESALFNLILTVFTIGIILLIDFEGMKYAHTANWDNFMPYGISGVFSGASLVFFSYIGFDSVTTLVEEMKNPKRDLPIGVIGSLALSIILYVSVAVVITLMVPYDQINLSSPLASAFYSNGVTWAQIVISIGAFAALTTTILNSMLGQARIYYSMARDGLLWPWVTVVHPRFQTPYLSTIATGAIATTFAFFIPIDDLAEMVSIGTLLAFTIVCCCIMWLNYKDANDAKRGTYLIFIVVGLVFITSAAVVNNWHISVPIIFGVATLGASGIFFFMPKVVEANYNGFKCPGVPVIPLLGIYFNVFMMANLGWQTWVRLLVWLIIGFIIYFGYGIHHSKLNMQVSDASPETLRSETNYAEGNDVTLDQDPDTIDMVPLEQDEQ